MALAFTPYSNSGSGSSIIVTASGAIASGSVVVVLGTNDRHPSTTPFGSCSSANLTFTRRVTESPDVGNGTAEVFTAVAGTNVDAGEEITYNAGTGAAELAAVVLVVTGANSTALTNTGVNSGDTNPVTVSVNAVGSASYVFAGFQGFTSSSDAAATGGSTEIADLATTGNSNWFARNTSVGGPGNITVSGSFTDAQNWVGAGIEIQEGTAEVNAQSEIATPTDSWAAEYLQGFPHLETSAQTRGTAASATPTINLPSEIQVGDVVIVLFRVAVGGAVGWPDASWNEVFDASSDAANDQMALAWHKGTGAEGATISLTCTSGKFAALAIRVSGVADPANRAPEFSTVATGDGTTPDPTTCTPVGGARNFLWVWLGGWEGEQTSPPTGDPTSFSGRLGADSGTASTVDTNCRVAMSFQAANAASLDAASWTISVSDSWTAYTMALRPAINAGSTELAKAIDGYVGAIASAAHTYNESETDTVTASDATRETGPWRGTETDTATLTDAMAGKATGQASGVDTNTATDSDAGKATGPASETDIVTLTDSDAGKATQADTELDSAFASDDYVGTKVTAASTYNESETDTVTLTDLDVGTGAQRGTETDTVTASDSYDQKGNYHVAEVDTATATDADAAKATQAATETDTASLTESYATKGNWHHTELDTATLSDPQQGVKVGGASTFNESQAETALAREQSDNDYLADIDVLHCLDAFAAALRIALSELDTVTALESEDSTKTSGGATYNESLNEAAVATDSFQGWSVEAAVEAQTATLTDAYQAKALQAASEVDTAVALDFEDGISTGGNLYTATQVETVTALDRYDKAATARNWRFWVWDGANWV